MGRHGKEQSKPIVYFDNQAIAPGFKGYVFISAYEHTTRFTDEFKEWLFNYQDGKCGYCGDSLGISWRKNIHSNVEHVIRKRSGGIDQPPNIMYACKSCNTQKGDRHYTELLIKIPMRRAGIAGLLRPAQAKALIDKGVLLIKPLDQFYFELCGWPHVNPNYCDGDQQ